MNKSSAMILRILTALVGAAALGFLLCEPQLEGRNAHATLFEIYFRDPFLAYAYIGSVPFFVALYNAFRALGRAGDSEAFPREAAKALRVIKYCSMIVIGFVVVGEVILLLGPSDDRAGGVFMGLLISSGAAVVAVAAALAERRLI